MNTDTHPDTDDIQAFLHNSESPEHAALKLHLAGCPACREEAEVLSALANHHACLDDIPGNADKLSEEQHQLITDYIDGKLQADECVAVKALINDNKYAMKSALHYSSHRMAMDNSLQTHADTAKQRTSSDTQQSPSILSEIFSHLSQWLDIRTPVWFTVPATALTVAVVIFSIQSFDLQHTPDANSQYVVATYQDNPVIQFRSSDILPGIGFFSKANNLSKEYNGVLVRVKNDDNGISGKIKLQWPRIKNAIEYSMRLQVFNQGQKITIGEVTSRAANATFDIDKISNNKRYEWVLTGKTSDEKTFYSTGGFVVSEAQ